MFSRQFKKLLSLLLYEVYNRKYQLELETSPRDLFHKLDDIQKRYIKFDNEFQFLTLPILFYWANDFIYSKFRRETVIVKFDPLNIDIAYVYINASWKQLKFLGYKTGKTNSIKVR